jgi:hypothetical protein
VRHHVILLLQGLDNPNVHRILVHALTTRSYEKMLLAKKEENNRKTIQKDENRGSAKKKF